MGSNNQSQFCYFLDLDCYSEKKRSFSLLVKSRMCFSCQKSFGKRSGSIAPSHLLANFKNCCSKDPKFITQRTPLLEAVFRIFLARENHPLNLEDLSLELRKWWGGQVHPQTLFRLMESDQYYGFRCKPESQEDRTNRG